MPKTRVLLLLNPFNIGGAPKVALDLLAELTDRVDLQTLALEHGPMAQRCEQLGELITLRPRYAGASRLRSLHSAVGRRASIRRVHSWQPQVIYANSVASLDFARQIDLPQAPVLLHVHELDAVIRSLVQGREQVFNAWPTCYLACSEAVRRALLDQFLVPASKITVLHECIQNDYAANAPDFVAANDAKPFLVGGSGTPELRKGIDLWLLMARELRRLAGTQPVRFAWVGMRDNFESHLFRDMARKMGLDDVIDFVPLTSDTAACYAKFDVFALTSWEDPFPLVVLENMMLRKPVICFADSGGAREALEGVGLIAPNFDPSAMAAAIYGLMQSPERCKQLGAAAAGRVQERYTTSVQSPKLYAEIMKLANQSV